MKILNQIKAGAKSAPAYLVILYYLFFLLDNVTTYLSTPDLKYEGNWLVKYFNLNWIQFILFYSFSILIVTFGLFVALSYVYRFYNDRLLNRYTLLGELLGNGKLLLSFFALACFYSHLINLGHIVINNIFVYIFLFQKSSCIYKFCTWYAFNQKYFLLYIQIVPLLIGYLVAFYKIKKIRNISSTIPS